MKMIEKKKTAQVYIAGSLRHSPVSWWEMYEKIGEVVEKAGMKPYIPHIHTVKVTGTTVENSILKPDLDDDFRIKTFEHSMKAIKNSELLIAELSYPSTGSGFEIGIAFSLKKKIICLAKRGTNITSMVRGAAKKGLIKLIDYDKEKEALNKLAEMLK